MVDDGGGLLGGVDEEGPSLGRERPLVDPTGDGDGGKEAEEEGETVLMRRRALLASQQASGIATSSLV